jgi:hypothetical protein
MGFVTYGITFRTDALRNSPGDDQSTCKFLFALYTISFPLSFSLAQQYNLHRVPDFVTYTT